MKSFYIFIVAGSATIAPVFASNAAAQTPMAVPFLVMQPGMGLGIAASRAPKPNLARMRSLITHTIFGLGLYGLAWVLAKVTPP